MLVATHSVDINEEHYGKTVPNLHKEGGKFMTSL